MKLSGFLKACLVGASLLVLQPVHAESAQAVAGVERQAAQPVNINRADAAALAEALRGIGMRKAEAIVAYRTEHGPFKSVDELLNIKGIGEKTLEQLRPQISI
jgi:competence protein ComEA